MSRETYVETFDGGPGGWLSWLAGSGGPLPLEVSAGVATARSPWGVDYNHAPPGGGYLQLPFVLLMHRWREALSGPNRFLDGGYSWDLTDARMTVRARGDIDLKGTQLYLLLQGDVGPIRTNWVLKSQPIALGCEWQDTTLHLAPDPARWQCMGTRGAGAMCDNYGEAPIEDLLRDVNVDWIFVLFPLDIQPAGPIEGDMHVLRAGSDYPVDESRLPSGAIQIDEVQLEYPD